MLLCCILDVYIYIYTVRQKLSTIWLVSIISFLIMNLFQIGLLFSLPVQTYLLTGEKGYWTIFIYVYMKLVTNASWHVSRMKQEELTPWNYLSVSSVSFVVLLFSFVFTSHILLVTKKWDSINKDTALVDLYRGESEKIKVYKNNLYYFSLDNNIL
jgi:hypothetical protein